LKHNNDNDDARVRRGIRFETFVRNVVSEYPSFQLHPIYQHFFPLSRILPRLHQFGLIPHNNNINNWLVPTLDKLKELFPFFLAEQCPRLLANYQLKFTTTNKNINNGDNEEEDKDKQNTLPRMERAGHHVSSKDSFGTYQAAKDVWEKNDAVARSLCLLSGFDCTCFYTIHNNDNGQLGFDDIPTFQNTILRAVELQ